MNLEFLLNDVSNLLGTDLYLIPGAIPAMTLQGRFHAPNASNNKTLTPEILEGFAKQVMSEKQWEDFQKTREANLAYMTKKGRFRVNAMFQRGAIALVFRRVEMEIPTLRQLGLPPVLREIALAPRGIALITGATGSGKSTTMASMIDYRNHVATGHIVSIEDPIEFVYQHSRSIVTQREVGIDTHSFQEALVNSLRQAPQVISIGEMRDSDTVRFALYAAETGHLVFATLHSTSAPQTIDRLMNFFPSEEHDQMRTQLAQNLRAIVSQRLVLREDRKGRAVAVEVMVNTPRIHNLIEQGDVSTLKQTIGADNDVGMQSIDRALFKLAKQGVISKEEALAGAESSNDLNLKLQGIGIDPGSGWNDFSDPWARVKDDYERPDVNSTGQMAARVMSGEYRNPLAGQDSPPIPPAQGQGGAPQGGQAQGGSNQGGQAQGTPQAPQQRAPQAAPQPQGGTTAAPGFVDAKTADEIPGGANHAPPPPPPPNVSGPSTVVERFADILDSVDESLDDFDEH